MVEKKVYQLQTGVAGGYNYLLHLPEGYTKEKQYPIVFFLHGAGERGNDHDLLCVHGPFKKIARGETFDAICVAPQCPEGSYWTTETQLLKSFIDAICTEWNADMTRVYLTGISMGGFGTWIMAIRYPEFFAAIVPICGGGMPWAGSAIKDLPIWAFHGDADGVVKPENSIDMVNAVNAAGGAAKLTLSPGVGHDSWTETYDNPEVWQWLLEQKKK